MSELIRLNKLMANQKMCSRREADHLIEQGWVKVDGKVITEQGTKVSATCHIEITSAGQEFLNKKLTVILNKPVGYVSGQAEERYQPASELIISKNEFGPTKTPVSRSDLYTLAPAGRLDIDSTGLLVLTQDGRVAKALIHHESKIEKEYVIRVEGELTTDKLNQLRSGLSLDGRVLKQAKVTEVGPQQLQFILTEGRKRQIRRMCELVNLKVVSLKRVRIGPIDLHRLPLGHWRPLSDDELQSLLKGRNR